MCVFFMDIYPGTKGYFASAAASLGEWRIFGTFISGQKYNKMHILYVIGLYINKNKSRLPTAFTNIICKELNTRH